MRTESIGLRSGETVSPLRVVHDGEVLHLCSKGRCPHYVGQLPLFEARPDDFVCMLTGYAPEKICGPLYCEAAEELDAFRREQWTMEDAERAERLRNEAAAAAGLAA